jgi:hypothetical protein
MEKAKRVFRLFFRKKVELAELTPTQKIIYYHFFFEIENKNSVILSRGWRPCQPAYHYPK